MADDQLVHAERKNRTMICTVVFADIVAFSERAVGDQTVIKDHFNSVFGEALSGVAHSDRIILDTGDGLAVCFFGDPEEGLFVALALRDAFGSERPVNVPDFLVRIGINLGPIKVVTDLNGRYNAIGDGINVAQRVMNFAEPGQVLCSRSYFEIVSRLSDDYGRLFEYCGVRHDKHVREHDVYEVRTPGSPATSGFDLPPAPPAAVKSLTPLVGEDAQERIAQILAKYEGPLARVLVRRAFSAGASLEEGVNAIAAQMHDQKESAEFVRLAKSSVRPSDS